MIACALEIQKRLTKFIVSLSPLEASNHLRLSRPLCGCTKFYTFSKFPIGPKTYINNIVHYGVHTPCDFVSSKHKARVIGVMK